MSAINISGARIASPKIIHPAARQRGRSPQDAPQYRDFDIWSERIFELDRVCSALGNASEGFSNVFPGQPITPQEASRLLSRYTAKTLEAMVAAVRAGEAIHNNPDWYLPWDRDDPTTGGLKRSVIACRVTTLMQSFPAARLPSSAFMNLLIGEVEVVSPSAPVLEATCRQLRRTCKSLPSIAEVVSAIEKQRERWADIYTAIDDWGESFNPQTKTWNPTGVSTVEHWRRELEAYIASNNK